MKHLTVAEARFYYSCKTTSLSGHHDYPAAFKTRMTAVDNAALRELGSLSQVFTSCRISSTLKASFWPSYIWRGLCSSLGTQLLIRTLLLFYLICGFPKLQLVLFLLRNVVNLHYYAFTEYFITLLLYEKYYNRHLLFH